MKLLWGFRCSNVYKVLITLLATGHLDKYESVTNNNDNVINSLVLVQAINDMKLKHQFIIQLSSSESCLGSPVPPLPSAKPCPSAGDELSTHACLPATQPPVLGPGQTLLIYHRSSLNHSALGLPSRLNQVDLQDDPALGPPLPGSFRGPSALF